LREDVQLLRSQASRCREILSTLAHNTDEGDAMYSRMSLGHLIEEVIEPYRIFDKSIEVELRRPPSKGGIKAPEPVLDRNAGVLYALTNLVENAVDYAATKVKIVADWNKDEIRLSIIDDGPGFSPHIRGQLGEPYVTTRARLPNGDSEVVGGGMGLGFFIAKTLLERSSATLTLKNRDFPESGAVVQVTFRRDGRNSVLVQET
jgi:two-component system sensor histidine kinase RegB